jgi:threonine dehydrogenase-like Zn-dependent dehydrogenase
MKVLQITAPGQTEWRDMPVPGPGPGEVLVRILGVATSATWDLAIADGTPVYPAKPIQYPLAPGQPGREAMGEIVAVGAGVARLRAGTRVACWRDAGRAGSGCYAQYVAVAEGHVVKVPRSLGPRDMAPLMLATSLHSLFDRLNGMGAVRGKRTGVNGLEAAGLVAVQMARYYGARDVVAIDPLPDRRRMALTLGASSAVSPDDAALVAAFAAAPTLDTAIDCTADGAKVESLLDRTRDIMAVHGVLTEDIRFTARHSLSGVGLLGHRHVQSRDAAVRALRLVNSGALKIAPLVTHTLPLERYPEGIELLRTGQAIIVCFDPWQ